MAADNISTDSEKHRPKQSSGPSQRSKYTGFWWGPGCSNYVPLAPRITRVPVTHIAKKRKKEKPSCLLHYTLINLQRPFK